MGDRTTSPEELTVAVVDDDARIGWTVATILKGVGFAVRTYTDPERCLAELSAAPVDILITDLQMPGMDGLDLLARVKAAQPQTEVVMLTGEADKSVAIQALKAGAYDFFEKPVDAAELVETIRKTARYQALLRERNLLAQQLSMVSEDEARRWGIHAFVGASEPVRKMLRSVRLLQASPNTSVLITGESGTGKELVARAIHFGSTRVDKPFVPVNGSAVPGDLAESLLFGHVKGAFTGAAGDKQGCFQAADGGTIFLDEVGDMSAAVQAKLLRVLEDGMVTPVGGTVGRHVDVRVLAATNADLERRISAGAFRSDLLYRLAGYTIELPPLRQREEDVPLLVEHFTRVFAAEMGFGAPAFSPEAMTALRKHPFPGNVRELRNLVERALLETGGGEVQPQHLHFLHVPVEKDAERPVAGQPPGDLPLNLRKAETMLIRKAVAQADGNMAAAARLLGINRTKLYRKLAAIGV